ncbi:MAG: glucose 1-dehydrogenase [Chloroflexi bacterium]|nr:glucose 1-dehydrogenase [Chloroflexota bacterium]
MVAPMPVEWLFEHASACYPDLRGKTAVISGASRNIGLAIAARLAREGMRLALSGLAAEEVEAAASDLRQCGAQAVAFPGDLSQPGEAEKLVDSALASFGKLHLLVNNAAVMRRFRSAELSEAEIDLALAANLKAPLVAALRAAPAIKAAGGGSIINISSVGGLRAQLPGLPYGMTKGGMDALTRNLAVDLAADGIRVNAVAPGLTRTRKPGGLSAAEFEERSRFIPLNRPGELLEIAAVVAFLASREASYITGQVIYVDGGATAQLHPPGLPF